MHRAAAGPIPLGNKVPVAGEEKGGTSVLGTDFVSGSWDSEA